MSNRTVITMILFVLLIVFHIVLFVLPIQHTDSFWLTYGFTLVAFIGCFICSFLRSEYDSRYSFLNYTIVSLSSTYLLVQLIVSTFCIFFNAAAWQTLIACVLPAGGYIILMFMVRINCNHAQKVAGTITLGRKNNHHPLTDLPDDNN